MRATSNLLEKRGDLENLSAARKTFVFEEKAM